MKHKNIFCLSAILSTLFVGNCELAHAVDQTWLGLTGDWNTTTNWSPGAVPAAGDDGLFTGTLPPSSTVSVTGASPIFEGIQFITAPRQYSFKVSAGGTLQMNGGGVDNSSLGGAAVNQQFLTTGTGILTFSGGSNADIGSTGKVIYDVDQGGTMLFNASAANAAIFNVGFTTTGTLTFATTSTANTAEINIENSGLVSFNDSSTPAGSIIDVDSGTVTFNTTASASTAQVSLSNTATLNATKSIGLAKLTSANSTDQININGGFLQVAGTTTGDVIIGKMSGTGIFSYAGTGNLTIANTANNYTGVTLVESGTLIATTDTIPTNGTVQTQAAGTINLNNTVNGTATGTFNNFGTILYTGSAAATLSGPIAQNGAVVVNAVGTGSLAITSTTAALSSAQVTAGTLLIPFTSAPNTTIDAGATLNLTQGGGSGTQTFTNNGTLIYSGTNTATLNSPGTITGIGNLVVNAAGAGKLVLNNTNTYTGNTTVQDGTLTVVENALPLAGVKTVAPGAVLEFNYNTGGTFSGNITNNGTVATSGTGNITLSGNISGTGSLESNTDSPSSLFLRGTNTYLGGTLVAAGSNLTTTTQSLPTSGIRQIDPTGTLIFDNTSSDTYSGTFLDNGLIQVASTANITFTGLISGSGGLTINSPSQTITLTANNNYTGPTGIAAGKLDIAPLASGTFPSAITMLTGTQLNLDQPAATIGTYTGGLAGAGLITVNQDGGTGRIVLTGPTSFTGITTVFGGELQATPANLPLIVGVQTNALVDLEQVTGSGIYAGVISNSAIGQLGAVAINKQGGLGTVVFTGANTYSGGTTVYNGILQGTTTSLQGNIVVNAGTTVAFNQTAISGTYSGNISGLGGVSVDSLGQKVTFTGNNTYAGPTNVIAGILDMIRSTTGTLAGQLVIQTGAQLNLDQLAATVGTYSGGVSGGGLLTINQDGNTGTVVLTGPSTFTGITRVYNGELQATPTSLPGGNVAISTNGLVDIEQSIGSGTYAGIISDNGSGQHGKLAINKNGGIGTVILTGANTYSGGTTVFNGKLQGTTVSLQRDILVNSGAIVDFEQISGLGTYTGVISGLGGVVINSVLGNTGTVEFKGFNTYSGGTLVSGGTLKGDSRSLQGLITDNATLEFDQKSDGVFNGSLAGNGIVEKQGYGRLTFNTNSSAFTGTTNIRRGRLALQNTLGGNVIAHATGILSGNGSVLGNVTIRDGGFIAPGNSVGTLFVGGNYLQEGGGTYIAQFNGLGFSSLIDIQGTGTLDPGSILFCEARNDDVLINHVYTILTADGGRNGQFSFVASDNILIDPIVTYDSNNAYVNLSINFDRIAKTYNQMHVADQLETIPVDPSPELQEFLQQLAHESLSEAQDTLTQMSGVQYTNLILTAELANRQFIRRLFDPLRSILTENPCTPYTYCCYQPTFDVWGSVSGGKTFIHGNKNAPGFRISDFEITGGVQSRFTRCLTAGAAISYERDNISYRAGGSGTNNNYLGAIYALYRPQRFYILGDFIFGYNNNRTTRTIDVGKVKYKPKSSTNIYQTTGYIELGTDFGFHTILIQPFIGFEMGHYSFGGFRESGGSPLNLTVSGKSRNSSYSRLGFHFTSAPISCGFNSSVDLAWRYRLTSNENSMNQFFQDFGDTFRVKGLPLQRNSFEATVFFAQDLGKHWQAYVEATGEGWDNSFSYSFVGGLMASW